LYGVGRNAYRSDDGGLSWSNLTGYKGVSILGEWLSDVAPSPRDPDEVAALVALIAAQIPPLELLCAAAQVSILQCRSTSSVFREDRPSQESSSSGSRPMMCPSS